MSLQGEIVLRMQSQQVVNNSRQTEDSLRKVGTQADQTGKKIEFNAARATGAMVGLASSATTAFFAYDNFNKLQVNIERSSLMVEKAQDRVNKMMQEGKTDTEQYRLALEDLRIKENDLDVKKGDLTRSQAMFGLSLLTMATSTIPTAITALRGLGAANTVTAASQATLTGSIVGTTRAIWGKTLALAANPIFAIATAASIAAAVALVASNTLGLRDAIFGTTKAVDQNTTSYKAYAAEIDNTSMNIVALNQNIGMNTSSLRTNTEHVSEAVRMWDSLNVAALNAAMGINKATSALGQVNKLQKDVLDLMREKKSLAEDAARQQGLLAEAREQLQKDIDNLFFGVLTKPGKAANIGGQADALIKAFLSKDFRGTAMTSELAIALGATFSGGQRPSAGGITTFAGRSLTQSLGGRRSGGVRGSGAPSIPSVSNQLILALTGHLGDRRSQHFFASQAQASINHMLNIIIEAGMTPTAGPWNNYEGLAAYQMAEVGPQSRTAGQTLVSRLQAQYSVARQIVDERIRQQTAEANFIGVSLSQFQGMLGSQQGMSDIAGMRLYKELAAMA